MVSSQDVSLVVEKIQAAMKEGGQCSGMIGNNNTVQEWRDIFNEAAKSLAIPVVHIGPAKSPKWEDVRSHVTEIAAAFAHIDAKALSDKIPARRFLFRGSSQVRDLHDIVAIASKSGKDAPVIILNDSAGDAFASPDMALEISNSIGKLTERFKEAIFIMAIPTVTAEPVTIYCMNPKNSRDPSQPIFPV